jgi:D-amino-acid dehydrogenase
MVGVCTALHLQQRGVAVLLVDRRGPGQETSHGNAGVIQQEAVAPYAFPFDIPTLFGALLRRRTDIHWHANALPGLWTALARYAWHSLPPHHAAIAQAYSRLVAHATSEHEPLIDACGAHTLVSRQGFRFVYRSARALEQAARDARTTRDTHGVPFQVLDAAALARAEPALLAPLAGALHWTSPWSVSDPGTLVAHYARLFQQRGGSLVQADALTLQAHGGGWRVRSGHGWHDGAQAVVALGPWSGELARRLGWPVPLFAKRGYHMHHAAPLPLNLPLLDAERGYVLAPMRRGLRLTTGAELARMDAAPTPVQLGRAQTCARELLDLGPAVDDTPWVGHRPCMADMLPAVGPVPGRPGLWFNFGHGHQGFTLGPVSGRLLAEQLTGDVPVVNPSPYLPARF